MGTGFLESITFEDPLFETEGLRLLRCSFSVAIPVQDSTVDELGGDDAAKRAIAPSILETFQDQIDTARAELLGMEVPDGDVV